jgi:hypothetical protein
MHPKTFQEYQLAKASGEKDLCNILVKAKHFNAPAAMVKVALSLSDDLAGRKGFAFPVDARLPARAICLTCETQILAQGTFYIAKGIDAPDGDDWVVVNWFSNGAWTKAGSFKPGSLWCRPNPDADGALRLLWDIAFILSLMNTPRLVIHEQKQAPRQQRRLMERTFGHAVAAYTEVRWTIGKPKTARTGTGTTTRGLPLHWNRAHWQKANEGEPKAEWRSSGPHGAGWYRWVSDYYAGHPDFGIKLQMHAPRMLGDKTRPGGLVPHGAMSAERLAVMDEQKRVALEQWEASRHRTPHLVPDTPAKTIC